jgi:hypothetical protein
MNTRLVSVRRVCTTLCILDTKNVCICVHFDFKNVMFYVGYHAIKTSRGVEGTLNAFLTTALIGGE